MGLHQNLNPEQKKVIQNTNGIVLVISGPGTGKTTTIQHYIVEIINNKKIKPEEILAVTFTNKAADEMKERVRKMTGVDPSISTIHSFSARVLRKFPPKGYESGFQIADDRTQFQLTAKWVQKLGIKDHPFYVIERLTLARNLRDKKILQDENLEGFYRLYMKELIGERLIDYDGLLTWCCYIFENNARVREYYQERFKHVLVDEFQDVSPIQYFLLYQLVQKQRNFLVVGDFDQSIYKFRGADVNIMLNLEKDFPEVKTLFLGQNYRSTSNIILSANKLIKNNSRRKDKPLWTKNGVGEPPMVLSFLDERQEAQGIAERIQDSIKKGGKFEDFAILYRVHILSRIFEEVFSSLQIPYQIIGGMGYFQRPEVQNVLAFYRLVREPDNTEALHKAMQILAQCKGVETKSVNHKNFGRLLEDFNDNLCGLISEVSKMERLEEIYDSILEITGYIDFLKKDKSTEGEKWLENVEELRSVLCYFDKTGKTIEDFLKFVESTGIEKGGADSVKLMTVHAAKGLEFDTVFVVGAEKGMFPHFGNCENEEDIEEERRLFYVAITRPKNMLYITYPKKRIIRGKDVSIQPSEFIDEMGIPSKRRWERMKKIKKFEKKDSSPNELTKDEISEGSIVTHFRFGKGYIVAIQENPGETLIKVDFVQYGLKTLILEYADLKLVKN